MIPALMITFMIIFVRFVVRTLILRPIILRFSTGTAVIVLLILLRVLLGIFLWLLGLLVIFVTTAIAGNAKRLTYINIIEVIDRIRLRQSILADAIILRNSRQCIAGAHRIIAIALWPTCPMTITLWDNQ